MGNDDNSENSREEVYTPGEKNIDLKIDKCPHNSEEEERKRVKVDLFFSLYNVVNPNLTYSFYITIINNIKLNIETCLGELEYRSGKNIVFGKTFEINYFFEREQCLLIESKINGKNTGINKRFILSELIRSPDKKMKLQFETIGLFVVSFKQKEMGVNPLKQFISSFQFTINLNNKIFGDNILNHLYFIHFII